MSPVKELLGKPESLSKPELSSSMHMPITLLERFLFLASEVEMPYEGYSKTALFKMIYISGPLSSDKDKCIILDKIYGVLMRKEDDQLKNICRKILRSVNLEDEGTQNVFSPFFYYFPELREKYKINVINCWDHAVGYWNVFKLWDDELPKECMTTLDLSWRKIDDDSVKLLASSLREMENLEYLSLSGNKIGDDGAKYIVESLREMENLEILYLNGNNIGNEMKIFIGKIFPNVYVYI